MTNDWSCYLLRLQPEPWTAPSVGVGRRNGKPFPQVYQSEAQRSYKEAVREELAHYNPVILEGPVQLRLYFWRALPVYVTDSTKHHRKHRTDLTNLQKLLEDSLQGVLFANDRNVIHIESWLVEQEPDTDSKVMVCIAPCLEVPKMEIEVTDHIDLLGKSEPEWDVKEVF